MTKKPHYRWKHGVPRTVFITGSSSGIGRDMARRLAATQIPARYRAQHA